MLAIFVRLSHFCSWFQLMKSSRESQLILAEAMDLSGKYIDIVPDPSVSEYARATIRVSEASGGTMTLAYGPQYEDQLGYLVGHECGHVIRMYSVPDEARLAPVTTANRRARVTREWYPHLQKLSRIGVPDDGLADLVTRWLEGIIRQLWNFPADMRIERWIRESIGLRSERGGRVPIAWIGI